MKINELKTKIGLLVLGGGVAGIHGGGRAFGEAVSGLASTDPGALVAHILSFVH